MIPPLSHAQNQKGKGADPFLKKKSTNPEPMQKPPSPDHIHDFVDMILPGIIKFMTNHYICGNTYRSCWAFRECFTSTTQQALLQHLGEKAGVTLKNHHQGIVHAAGRSFSRPQASYVGSCRPQPRGKGAQKPGIRVPAWFGRGASVFGQG